MILARLAAALRRGRKSKPAPNGGICQLNDILVLRNLHPPILPEGSPSGAVLRLRLGCQGAREGARSYLINLINQAVPQRTLKCDFAPTKQTPSSI